MDSKVCLINSFWLGDRRYEIPEYKEDKLYFVKKQIEVLQTQKHNLTKIIFNFNIIPEHYHYLAEVFSITPKQIQGAEVEINIRENVGISYGAWSDCFSKYKSEYDYYVFNEDDYFFVQDNWDEYLVNKHNSYNDCGYLCMHVAEPDSWNDYKKHAGSSVGIASSETLMKIWNKHKKLPSLSKNLIGDEGNYEGWSNVQINFGFAFLEVGLNVYDVRDDYAILFQKDAPIGTNIQYWGYFTWNPKYLQKSASYLDNLNCWITHDLEFTQDYSTTTFKEALGYFNHKLPYHEDGYDENGAFNGWVKRKLNTLKH
jgi:hypothetical protein